MTLFTLSQLCSRDGIPIRTAQRHRYKISVGTLYGNTYALTDEEWKLVLESIDSAEVGNPNWKK